MIKEYRSFERDKPDKLVQADLTRFNGIPILTMEDDHSRKFWAVRLENETTKCYPEERYSGQRDIGWYVRFVKALKLELILPLPVAVWG